MTLDAVANPDADGVVGSIVMYAGEILPSAKWRWAHGAQEISRTEFSLYYSRVGDRWGNGDGSTTVDLPNFDKKFPVGMDSSGADADYETGDTGGAASGALPANTGAGTSHVHGAGSYAVNAPSAATSGAAVAGFTSTGSQAVSGVSGPENSHTHPLTGSVPTIPPYNAVRFIVKVA
jgi:microcystin-dependent protein